MPAWLAVVIIAALVIVGIVGLVQERQRPKRDPDQVALDYLQEAGSNLSRVHQVEFLLLFPTREQAQRAAEELSRAGYSAIAESGDTDTSCLCKATKSLVPALDTMKEVRGVLSTLAMRVGGTYDGWGAGVEK